MVPIASTGHPLFMTATRLDRKRPDAREPPCQTNSKAGQKKILFSYWLMDVVMTTGKRVSAWAAGILQAQAELVHIGGATYM